MINLGFLGFPNYEVDIHGHVYNMTTHKEVKPQPAGDGYMRVKLYRNGEYQRIKVHVIMGKAYLNPEYSPFIINHKDGNRANNDLKNLELISQSGNVKHAWQTGRRASLKGRKLWVLRDYNGEIKLFSNIKDASNEWTSNKHIWQAMFQETIR